MRTNKPPREFFSKMKKKPALQKILDTLDDYTVEELESINGQPLWIRQQLIELKTRGDVNVDVTAEQFADMMPVYKMPPPAMHDVFCWIGGDWQMPCGRTSGMKIEITVNDLLFVQPTTDPQTICVGISSSTGYLSGSEKAFFLQNVQFIRKMTRVDFAAFVSDSLTKQHQGKLSMAKIEGLGPVDSDDRGIFRIIRH